MIITILISKILFLVYCCLICVINSSSVLDHTTISIEGSSTSIHTDINNLINTNNINNQQSLNKKTIITKTTSTMSNSNGKHILVTGGAGYIGTHTILCLLDAGYSIIVLDNLINSSSEGLDRIKLLTTISSDIISSRLIFHHVDLCNLIELEEIFNNYHTNHNIHFDCCIHFAGLKAVGESVQKPLLYYENNIGGTINLLNMMDKYKCYSIVFSSSATVYGSAVVPITEETPTGHGITNAYGRTKFMIEEILTDFKRSKDLLVNTNDYIPWSVVILRYFNPVGAHPSGRIKYHHH